MRRYAILLAVLGTLAAAAAGSRPALTGSLDDPALLWGETGPDKKLEDLRPFRSWGVGGHS